VPEIKAPLYAADGASKGTVNLDPDVFGIEPNMAVLHQVVTAQLAAKRAGTASTKTRAEVRGGGAKPWRQKGLGRARHGSIRSPIWVGGGIAHGPKPRDYSQRTPKKMKRLALRGALSARASEGAVLVVDAIDWSEPKTRQAKTLLEAIGADTKTLVVLNRADTVASKSFRNLANVQLVDPGHVTAYDVLASDRVVFTSHTVGSVGTSGGGYAVSDDDFVRETESKETEPKVAAEEGGEG
jgi:large subunit ribosomal protein L4